jgi:hypothetical protein
MKREHSIDVAAVLALAALVVALYRKVARLFWTYDDAYLLHIATVRRWGEYLTNGEVWRSMPQRLFTPLLTITYDSELSLFGLEPRWWYLGHLALLAAAVTAVYATLRLWLPPLLAFSGAALAALGAPVANLATELMLAHYLEAIALGALSVVFVVRGVRRGRPSIASALLYLAAMLAKEIAVPLVLLFFLIGRAEARSTPAGGSGATRSRLARRMWAGLQPGFFAPHFAALALYLVWRTSMLHTVIGGYGYTAPPGRILASLPAALAHALAGPRLLPGAILLAAMAIGIAAALRRNAWLVAGSMIVAIAPILPTAAHMQPRFAAPAWIWACASFAGGLATLPRRVAALLLIVSLAAAVVVNRAAFRDEFASSKRMSDEARVFLDLGADSLLRKPAIPPASLGELQWLKVDQLHRAAGSGWFYDDLFLCQGGAAGKRVWMHEGRAVREITADVPRIGGRYCASIRGDARLSADFHYDGGVVSWRLGPYHDGAYGLVIANGVQAFDVLPEDSFKVELQSIALRVRYGSPAGWVTYSPELALDFVHHPDVRWTR